ncbi:hypothetical protein V8J88_19955 [Massilia sp. W12]|uniref:hypothetical protein n=1 Tax=Massilia sp. W12 TaxID=3126507 RepID=UPI0030CBE01C
MQNEYAYRLHPGAEMELAMELLSVSSEAELNHFLGNLFKKVWGGIKKVGSVVGKFVKPLGGVLKGLAKKALPFVGGALGSLIPIPGVGTMLGKTLGTVVSNALEMEFGHLEQEEAEFEMARRFVRIAASAAGQVAQANPAADAGSVVQNAVLGAVKRHLPQAQFNRAAASVGSGGFGFGPSRNSGAWHREGGHIVLEL